MIKSLTALAIFGLLGAAVVALPGFAPRPEAGETVALAKAGRVEVRPVAQDCLQQVWPNFDTSCLRNSESGMMIRDARLVTARR
jgi:hypothetical protein